MQQQQLFIGHCFHSQCSSIVTVPKILPSRLCSDFPPSFHNVVCWWNGTEEGWGNHFCNASNPLTHYRCSTVGSGMLSDTHSLVSFWYWRFCSCDLLYERIRQNVRPAGLGSTLSVSTKLWTAGYWNLSENIKRHVILPTKFGLKIMVYRMHINFEHNSSVKSDCKM